jgi:hypothetical protein
MTNSALKRKRGDRKDAFLLRDADTMHLMFPFIYLNRTDCEALLEFSVDAEPISSYLEKLNADCGEYRYTLFHIVCAALAKTVTLRPKLNRFYAGFRYYQRHKLSIAFVAKKKFTDDGGEALVCLNVAPEDTLHSIHEHIASRVHRARKEDSGSSTDEAMRILLKLPMPIVRFAMFILRALDKKGWVPQPLIEGDTNYCSIFLTDIGSIHLDANYHHLSNWGTNSIFVVMGEKKPTPVLEEDGTPAVKEMLPISITLDERIADGYYYSGTLRLLRFLLKNPELLELEMNEPVEY